MTWTCPDCGKTFRNRNQWHSCYTLDLEDHLRNKPEEIGRMVNQLISSIESFGPIELYPVKSAIQVKAGATFLSIKPRKDHVELEFQLSEVIEQFPIHRHIQISGKRVLHFLYLSSPEDISDQLIQWLKASYELVKNAQINTHN